MTNDDKACNDLSLFAVLSKKSRRESVRDHLRQVELEK